MQKLFFKVFKRQSIGLSILSWPIKRLKQPIESSLTLFKPNKVAISIRLKYFWNWGLFLYSRRSALYRRVAVVWLCVIERYKKSLDKGLLLPAPRLPPSPPPPQLRMQDLFNSQISDIAGIDMSQNLINEGARRSMEGLGVGGKEEDGAQGVTVQGCQVWPFRGQKNKFGLLLNRLVSKALRIY